MFKVTVEYAGRYIPEADEHFVVVITNRAGRKWHSNYAHGCPGNAGESAMVLEEYINDGNKINKDDWTEVAA